MSVNMNTITNKDAKMIYAKYWHKNMSMEMFPTIYIDKYWDYTINLFELNDDWNWFLERFNEEFKSAKEYIEESERVKGILLDNFCWHTSHHAIIRHILHNDSTSCHGNIIPYMYRPYYRHVGTKRHIVAYCWSSLISVP